MAAKGRRTGGPAVDQASLFGENKLAAKAGPKQGLVVTNHLNLEFMVSAGLIMPPNGFGSKYYTDPLESFHGWIPLFRERVPSQALQLATNEAGHLRPCVAQVRLDAYSGPAFALRDSFEEISFPDDCRPADRAYLIPGPLPSSWIDRVLYGSNDDKMACRSRADELGNVPLRDFVLKVDRNAFERPLKDSWPPSQDIPVADPPIAIAQTAGAIQAMLLNLANRGPTGIDACRTAFDPDDQAGASPSGPVLSLLRSWMRNGRMSTAGDERAEGAGLVQGRIFWELVDRLTARRASRSDEGVQDITVGHLRNSAQNAGRPLRKKLRALADDLESISGFSELGPAQMFQRYASPFARAIVLLALRDSCLGLLEFEEPQLNEDDRLTAAILFAAREGWERLPLRLRDTPGLAVATCHRMAATAHRLVGSGADLGPSASALHSVARDLHER